MQVQPIDTEYAGYKFRSRLEARWALFLDRMQTPYLYEPEGFQLGDLRYLPDFHLPEGIHLHHEPTPRKNIWLEIKPSPDLNEDDRQKIAQFVKQTKYHLLLIAGDPGPDATIRFITFDHTNKYTALPVKWIQLPNGRLGLIPLETLTTNPTLQPQTETPTLLTAYTAARQARFEAGETQRQITPQQRNCQNCGRSFHPAQPYHNLCRDCYRQSQDRPEPTQPSITYISAPRAKTTPRRVAWAYGLAALALLSLLTIAAFAFLPGLNQNNTTLPTAQPTAAPLPTTTNTPSPTATTPPTNTPSPTPTCTCTTNTYDCANFPTQSQAQTCFDTCFPTSGDIHQLDNDADRAVCESLP